MWFHIWIWAPSELVHFKKETSLGTIFWEVPLDFHFIGAALLKADSLTVLITYSFAVCFNILQYLAAFTILIIAHWHLPFHSYKVKTQPHTHRLEQIIHYRTENWVPVIRCPLYRIETAISKAQNVVHVWAGTFQAKKSLGTILRGVVGFPF